MDTHREIRKNDQGPADALTPAVKPFVDQFTEQVYDHQMTYKLMNATETHLDHLNEDCLLEIFSAKSLTPMDLCALAETCKLFKRIAQRVFSKTLRIYKGYRKYSIAFNDNGRESVESAHNVERIFRNCGRCFVTVKVDATDIMKLVAKHCVGGTLKELEIGGIKITELAVELQSIFQQLRKLTINEATIQCGANVFTNCDSLIELIVIVIGANRYDAIMDNNFPKLQRFTFVGEDYFGSAQLFKFLERHKTLKHLHWRTHDHRFNSTEFFPKLGNSCKELEDLEIWFEYGGGSTIDFYNFQKLKRLKLVSRNDDIVVRLQNAKSLEVLEIYGWWNAESFMADLPSLKNLRAFSVYPDFVKETVQVEEMSLLQLTKLILTGSRSVNYNVVDLIRQLSNLEELNIYSGKFVLSKKEFQEIVKLTKGRRNFLTLTCQFKFSQYSNGCDENLKVKLIKWTRQS